jgi:hypothetical protein
MSDWPCLHRSTTCRSAKRWLASDYCQRVDAGGPPLMRRATLLLLRRPSQSQSQSPARYSAASTRDLRRRVPPLQLLTQRPPCRQLATGRSGPARSAGDNAAAAATTAAGWPHEILGFTSAGIMQGVGGIVARLGGGYLRLPSWRCCSLVTPGQLAAQVPHVLAVQPHLPSKYGTIVRRISLLRMVHGRSTPAPP